MQEFYLCINVYNEWLSINVFLNNTIFLKTIRLIHILDVVLEKQNNSLIAKNVFQDNFF